MNSDTLKGKWMQIRGEAKQAWGKLSDDELTEIEGNMEKLIGKLQEKYGYSRDRAQMDVENFTMRMDQKYR